MNWAQFFVPPTPLLPLSPHSPPLCINIRSRKKLCPKYSFMLDNMAWYYKAQSKNLRTKKVAIENPINEFFNGNVMTLRVGIQFCETAPMQDRPLQWGLSSYKQ
jgi:hypothetical protein